jgi:hypothetical protein
MIQLERMIPNARDFAQMDAFLDRVIFQTEEWVRFIAEAQLAEPVYAAVVEDSTLVGYFTGLMVRRLGVPILGSPLLGWTTSYMGFNLSTGTERREAKQALFRFAFRELKCAHVEFRDRHFTRADAEGTGLQLTSFPVLEIDLRPSEAEILARMTSACRRCIRKAERVGLTVECASDREFAKDYYAQLQDVFRKQGLTPTYGLERVEKLIEHVYPTGRLLLLRARDPSGRCIGTGIFPGMNGTAYFWGGASWREHQILRPNEFIFWHAIRYWKQRGMEKLDLGGGGHYKLKYGPTVNNVPSILHSRWPVLLRARDLARFLYRVRQKATGRVGNAFGASSP